MKRGNKVYTVNMTVVLAFDVSATNKTVALQRAALATERLRVALDDNPVAAFADLETPYLFLGESRPEIVDCHGDDEGGSDEDG